MLPVGLPHASPLYEGLRHLRAPALRQGLFKSILVEDWDRLAWLCHYIHLNPVRAGVCDMKGLKAYQFSSYWNLRKTKTRSPFMKFEAFLEGAGSLKDDPAGRAKYEQYLEWLSQDDQTQRNAAFEKMGKGWALGSRQFKKAIVDEEKPRLAQIELGTKDYTELKEELWASELDRCLKLLGKRDAATAEDPKSADWKVAIATRLKRKLLCRNP